MAVYHYGFTRSNKEQGRPKFYLKSAIKIWRAKTLWWVFYGNKQHSIKLPYERKSTNLFNVRNNFKFLFSKFSLNKLINIEKFFINKKFLDVNFKNFFAKGISLVGPSYKADPEITPYLSGSYQGNDISSFRWNYFVYRQTFLFLSRSQIWNHGFSIHPPIIHIASREEITKQNRMVANLLNHQHVSVKWIGGILTNTRLKDLRKLISNARTHNLTGKEPYWISKPYFRQKIDLPAVLLIWDTHHNDYAVNDGIKLKIPILGVVDNLVNPRRITYPLIGQNFDEEIIKYYQKFVMRIFFHGQLMHNKDKKNSFVFFFKNEEFKNHIYRFWSKFVRSGIFNFFLKKNYGYVLKKINKSDTMINKLKKTNLPFSPKQSLIDFFESFFNFSGVRSHFKLYRTFRKWKDIYNKMKVKKSISYKKFFKKKIKFRKHRFRKKTRKYFRKIFSKNYFFNHKLLAHKISNADVIYFHKQISFVQNHYKFRFIIKTVKHWLWPLHHKKGRFIVKKPHLLYSRFNFAENKFFKFFNLFKLKRKKRKHRKIIHENKYYGLKREIKKRFKHKYLFRRHRKLLERMFKKKTRIAKIKKFFSRLTTRYRKKSIFTHFKSKITKKILKKNFIEIMVKKFKIFKIKTLKKMKILKKIRFRIWKKQSKKITFFKKKVIRKKKRIKFLKKEFIKSRQKMKILKKIEKKIKKKVKILKKIEKKIKKKVKITERKKIIELKQKIKILKKIEYKIKKK